MCVKFENIILKISAYTVKITNGFTIIQLALQSCKNDLKSTFRYFHKFRN